jgi:aminoglycoside phosphotransferase (APT) family kinase protein
VAESQKHGFEFEYLFFKTKIFNESEQIILATKRADARIKIDSKTQRRIQCAIPLKALYNLVHKEFNVENKLVLPSINSPKRIRNN